ncbi:MAG TPA: acyltransferase [Bacteroidia bacterium]|jgi:peptidoglycan/LPS O-acetylase OafA/YrhL
MAATLQTGTKVNYLEGIRGIAAFMVLGHHFMLAFYPGAYDNNPVRFHTKTLEHWYYASPLNVLTNGNFCVTIFFVLSGYVLSRRYWQQKDISIVSSAAKRRFPRLFIPVAFTLILSYILLNLSLYKHKEAAVISHSDWWLGTLWPMDPSFGTLMQYMFKDVMFLGSADYDTSMWTMKLELFGSFIVFGLLLVTHFTSRKGVYFIFLGAIFVFLALNGQAFYYIGFVCGMMLNDVEAFMQRRKHLNANYVLVPALIIAGLFLGSYPSLNFAHYGFWEFVYKWSFGQKMIDSFAYVLFHTAGAMMLVTAVVISPGLQKLFSTRIFRFLGLISFSFYLLHPLVIGAFSCPMMIKLVPAMGYNKAGMLVLALTAALTIFISWLMAITVDRFSIDISKKYLGNASDRKKPLPVKKKKEKIIA